MKEETRLAELDTESVKACMVSIRGQMALLDRDIAELYGVEPREINQAERNDPGKFPITRCAARDGSPSITLRDAGSFLESGIRCFVKLGKGGENAVC